MIFCLSDPGFWDTHTYTKNPLLTHLIPFPPRSESEVECDPVCFRNTLSIKLVSNTDTIFEETKVGCTVPQSETPCHLLGSSLFPLEGRPTNEPDSDRELRRSRSYQWFDTSRSEVVTVAHRLSSWSWTVTVQPEGKDSTSIRYPNNLLTPTVTPYSPLLSFKKFSFYDLWLSRTPLSLIIILLVFSPNWLKRKIILIL